MTTPTSPTPVLFIMGPTASGKTDLAVALAQRFPFEIVSVDSALIYRGMDIGTAKPDADTLRLAPHRLIDILDPAESYSAGRFRVDAQREIVRIHGQGRIPLLVGGTMLYFRALQQGLSELPPAHPELRARLAAELAARGSAALHTRLAVVDPVAAARIHPNDPQRIQRALEVFEITGRPITELYASEKGETFALKAIKLAIAPTDRQILHQRIEQRFHRMLERGFVAEVEGLHARGDLDLEKPSMRAVGYRQVWHYLDGGMDYREMTQRGIVATRQFAKRQLTWLRSEADAIRFDALNPFLLDLVIERLRGSEILPKLD